MPGKKEESKLTQMSLEQGNNPKRLNNSSKAGLVFPVAKILKKMKKGRYADRITTTSAVGTAAVLEYLIAEMIEMSADQCKNESSMIKPRHISLAIKKDEEMFKAIGQHVMIPAGGMVPFILNNSDLENLKDEMAEEASENESCYESDDN